MSFALVVVIPRALFVPLVNATLIVPIHELGHVIAALLCRIPIKEVSFFLPYAYVATDRNKETQLQSAILYIGGPAIGLLPYFALPFLGDGSATPLQMAKWLVWLGNHPLDLGTWVDFIAQKAGVSPLAVIYGLAHILLGTLRNIIPRTIRGAHGEFHGFNDGAGALFSLGNWFFGHDPKNTKDFDD